MMPGPVEVDGAYPGGREKNKHADKRGRSEKTAVAGIMDRATGTVRAVPVPETTAARLGNFIESNVAKGAKAFTDENKAYGNLDNHETVNHGEGESVRREVHVNGVESLWALVIVFSTNSRRDRSVCQRGGVALGPGEARVQRNVPPHRPQTPAPLHQRIYRTAQHEDT